MTSRTNPVLTGVVYVQGALEGDFPRRTVGRNAQCGDLRLHAHLDEKGLRARSRGFCRAGYSGYIRASLYDGKAWRKFMLALYVEPGKRHFEQNADRSRNAWSIILALQALKGRHCVYRDGAFACTDAPVEKTVVSAPVVAPAIEKAAEPAKAVVSQAIEPAKSEPSIASCPTRRSTPIRRRRRRVQEDSRQLRLF